MEAYQEMLKAAINFVIDIIGEEVVVTGAAFASKWSVPRRSTTSTKR